VAPSGLNSIALGQNWTNNLGARATLFISYKMADAATGDPTWYLTNFSSGLVFTNTVAFGLTATVQDTVTVPGISPNDFGRIVDASGTGASVTILKAYWILQ
jgi:hypothetical protein